MNTKAELLALIHHHAADVADWEVRTCDLVAKNEDETKLRVTAERVLALVYDYLEVPTLCRSNFSWFETHPPAKPKPKPKRKPKKTPDWTASKKPGSATWTVTKRKRRTK